MCFLRGDKLYFLVFLLGCFIRTEQYLNNIRTYLDEKIMVVACTDSTVRKEIQARTNNSIRNFVQQRDTLLAISILFMYMVSHDWHSKKHFYCNYFTL